MEGEKAVTVEDPPTPHVDNQHEPVLQAEIKDKITNEEGALQEPEKTADVPITTTPSLPPQPNEEKETDKDKDKKKKKNKTLSTKEKHLSRQRETRRIRETNVRLPTAVIKEVTIDDVLELKMSRKLDHSTQNIFSTESQRENKDEKVVRYKSFPIFQSSTTTTKKGDANNNSNNKACSGNDGGGDDDNAMLADDYLDKLVERGKEKEANKTESKKKSGGNEENETINKTYDPFQERNKIWDKEKEEIEALATKYTSGTKRKHELVDTDDLSASILIDNGEEGRARQGFDDDDDNDNNSENEVNNNEENNQETGDLVGSSSVQELGKILPQETQKEEEEFMTKCRKRMRQNRLLEPSDLFTGSSSLMGFNSNSQSAQDSTLITSSSSSMFSTSVRRSGSTTIDEYHDHNSNSEIISNDSRSSSLLMARNSLRKSSTLKSMDSANKVKKALFSTVIQSSGSPQLGTSHSQTKQQQNKHTNKSNTISPEPPKKVHKKTQIQSKLSFAKK